MIRILKISLLSTFIFVACGNPSDKKSEVKPDETISSNAPLKLPDNFYKKLKGKIGEKLFITMDIVKRKDSTNKTQSLSGYYYYDNIGMPLDIYGSINDSNKIELTERNNKGNKTGIFKGEFTNEKEMKGVWINPATKKEMPFVLTETTENIALFEFQEFHNENCDNRNKKIKSTKKDTLTWTDTLCSEINISLINITNLSKIAQRKINSLLQKSMLQMGFDTSYTTIQKALHSIDKPSDFDFIDAEYAMNVVCNEPNVLCMSVSYYANTGGAHPNGISFFINFNPQTGDTISLRDIVLPETMDELVFISKKKFIEANGNIKDNGWFYDEGEFKMTTNFALTKDGLLFQYQSYEAGSYAMGMPQYFIPFTDLKGIIKPEYLNKK